MNAKPVSERSWSRLLNRRVLGRLALFAILAAAVAGLTACQGRGAGHSHADHALDFIAFRLAFDEQQNAIVDKLKLEIADIRAESQQRRADEIDRAVELLNADKLDQAELEGIIEVHKQQAEANLPRLLPLLTELHQTLNIEQKAKLEKKLRHWQQQYAANDTANGQS